MLKARIFKHAGDPVTAYGFMDSARRLDTQDRYLNTKCVRYALRADELRKAEETVCLFLRDGEGIKALADLQASWYENAAAELHMRSKQYGRALKLLLSMDKHCVDMLEDQFDFHQYVLRKTTLRAYVDSIRWGNTLRGQRYHVRAALNIVRVYLRLYDEPREEAAHFEAVAAAGNFSEEQRKEEAKRIKAEKTKQRKADEKQAAAEAAAKLAAQPKPKQGQAKAAEDPDPEGAQLLATAQANPLQEATRFMQHLAAQHGGALVTQTLGVALYVRKQRFLLALRHLSKALALDASHPDTHVALASFLHAIRTPAVSAALHPAVSAALDTTLAASPALYGAGASVEQLNENFLKARPNNLMARVAYARVLLLLDPVANLSRATTAASQFAASDASVSRSEASEALSFLVDTLRAPVESVASFKKTALERFPLAVAFGAIPKPPQPIDAAQTAQAAAAAAAK
jgi:peptide alpha-N-acetyltransferase